MEANIAASDSNKKQSMGKDPSKLMIRYRLKSTPRIERRLVSIALHGGLKKMLVRSQMKSLLFNNLDLEVGNDIHCKDIDYNIVDGERELGSGTLSVVSKNQSGSSNLSHPLNVSTQCTPSLSGTASIRSYGSKVESHILCDKKQ